MWSDANCRKCGWGVAGRQLAQSLGATLNKAKKQPTAASVCRALLFSTLEPSYQGSKSFSTQNITTLLPRSPCQGSRISLWFCAILRVSETPKYLKVPRGEGSSPLIILIECLLHILDFLSIWILEPSWSAKGERVPSALLLLLCRWKVLCICFVTQAFHIPFWHLTWCCCWPCAVGPVLLYRC